MFIESLGLLANCFDIKKLQEAPKTILGQPRKHSYQHHPCSKWLFESKANFEWLAYHAYYIEKERLGRGYKPHFSVPFLDWVIKYNNYALVPSGTLTKFAIAISPDKNCRKVQGFDLLDRVTQYRLYYKLDKPFAKWKRNRPEWMDKTPEEICKLTG